MKYCKQCGAQMQEGCKFCVKCGWDSSQQKNAEPAEREITEPNEQQKKKIHNKNIKINKKIWFIAAIAAFVLAVVAVVIFLIIPLYSNNEIQTVDESVSAKTSTNETETSQTAAAIEEEKSTIATGTNTETKAANAMDNANTPTGNATNSSGVDTSNLYVGEVIKLGTYEQDGDYSDGSEAIEWKIIYTESGNYLLLSKYGLDAQPYNIYDSASVTWNTCSLRTWLNNDFYNSAFSDTDKSLIVRNPETNDMVSLLGYDSSGIGGVTSLITDETDRTCYATAYAVNKGTWVTSTNGHSPWWLRTMVPGTDNAYMVKSTGEISSNVVNNGANNVDVDAKTLVTVRPIIWIKGN